MNNLSPPREKIRALRPISRARLLGRGGMLLLAGLLTSAARADSVTLRGRPPFERVEVLAYKQGIVHFRGISKQTLQKPLSEVERLSIDGMDRFNEAEALAGTAEWQPALAAYDDATVAAGDGWRRDLIQARRLTALDASGAFDDAVAAFIEAVRATTAIGAPVAPSHPGPTGSPANRAARQALDQAVRTTRNPEQRRILRSLLLELLIVEDEDPPVRLFPRRATGADAPAPAPARPRRIQIDLPPPRPATGSGRDDMITLSPTSMVRPHILRLLDTGDGTQAVRAAERAAAYAAPDDRPIWLLLLGRARLEAGQAAVAAADLLKLAEEAGDPAAAAEALYYAALAHERLERPDVAASLYRELRDRDDLPADLRPLVDAGLERVK